MLTLIIVLPAQTANRCRLLRILANYFQHSESVSRIHPSIDRDLIEINLVTTAPIHSESRVTDGDFIKLPKVIGANIWASF